MLSEFHANSTQTPAPISDALTPKDPIAQTLSTTQSGRSFVKDVDWEISQWLNGGPGNAKLWGGVTNNRILGSRKSNRLQGGSTNNSIYGDAGADRLSGGSGNDILCGEMGNDNLVGGSGSDILKGGPGKDTLTSNSGKDWFIITSGGAKNKPARADIITDFTNGQDRINLENGLTFERLSITETKGKAKDTLLRDKATGEYLAVLKGVSKSSINSADFGTISVTAMGNPTPSPAPAPTPTPAPIPKPTPTPALGAIAFGATSYIVREGTGAATITVNRTGSTAGTARVNYTTLTGGTATSGADYTPVSGTLTFAAGQTSKTFAVSIVNDTKVESTETIGLALSNPVGAKLGQSRVTLTIADNDAKPSPTPSPTPAPAPSPQPSPIPVPIPVPVPVPIANWLFADNFETGLSTRWNPELPRSESLQVVTSPTGDGKAARFELRRTDRAVFGGKRAEVALDKSTLNRDVWYGFKIMLPKDWKPDKTLEIVSQWHDYPDVQLGEEYRSPPLAFTIKNNRWGIDNRWDPKPLTIGNDPRPEGGIATLWNGAYQTGVWTKWVVHAKWSSQSDGLLQIWKDGSLVVNKRGPNTYNDAYVPYFKVGIYKPAWTYSPELSVVNSRVLYVDDVRVGDSNTTYSAIAPR